MSIPVQINEATAARRRLTFFLVDATDYATPETGETGGQPQISVAGGAWTNTGIGVLVEVGNGEYYAEVTQATVNTTAGTVIDGRYKSANTAEARASWPLVVVTHDPMNVAEPGDAMTLTAAGVDLVWDELQSGHATTDSFGYMLDAAISTRAPSSTALSTATWTAQKAGYLDAAVSTLTAPTAAAVADAVWDEGTTAHSSADTFGAAVFRVLGLSNENTVIATATSDGDGRPLTGTKRIYNSAANANANDGVTGLVAAYSFTATYNSDGYPITYTETKS